MLLRTAAVGLMTARMSGASASAGRRARTCAIAVTVAVAIVQTTLDLVRIVELAGADDVAMEVTYLAL